LRLKRLLEREKSTARTARQALSSEMQNRTEVEKLFRSCVGEVQKDLTTRK